jgi:hypothetical protein
MQWSELWWAVPLGVQLALALALGLGKDSQVGRSAFLGAIMFSAIFWLGYLCCWWPGHVEVTVR